MASIQQDVPMRVDSLTADASTAAPALPAEIAVTAASESSESEERASKRRRFSSDSPAVHVESEEELCIIEPIPIAAAAGLHTSDVSRTAVEQSCIDCDESKQSSETDSSAASLDLVSPDSAASLPTATGSAAAKPASKRRAQACRYAGCGLVLSSASNRLRHEKSKHKPTMSSSGSPQQQQQQRHSSPAAFIDARSSYLHGAAAASCGAATSPPSPGPQTYRSASKRSSAAMMMNASSSPMVPLAWSQSMSEAEADAEEDDWELAQFIAARSAGSDSSAGPSGEDSEGRPLSASTSSGDDTKSDDGPPTDTQQSSSTPSSESDSNDGMSMNFPGNPLLYSDEEMQAGCQSFLVWLSEPPLTPCEFLVKGRSRLKSLAALIPIKNSLRFIYQLLAAKEETRPASVDLRIWTSLATSQALYSALCDRGVGSGRLHGIFLLVKKILVYLSGRDSIARRQYLPPNLIESYAFVTGICSENGLRRKTEARNKRLLGIQATKQLLLDHRGTHSAHPFTIPATWTASSKEVQHSPAPRVASSSSTAAVVPAVGPSNNEMSTAELKLVTKKCLASLQELMHAPLSSNPTKAGVQDRWFMCLVVTATLALGLAPRSMVLSQLKSGTSFTRGEDGRFWIRLIAEQTKNHRPSLISLPAELSAIFTHFLEHVRPRLLASATAGGTAQHDFVFMKRNGAAPRTEFNSCVNLVTQQFLGRPLNTHSFRSAITTAYYSQTCGSEHDLILLSQLMGHDVGTARAYYYKPKFSAAAVEANEKMKNFLLQSDV